MNARDEYDITPLMWAARHNEDLEVVRALIAAGADKNARDTSGERALDHLEENEEISKDDGYWKVRDML